MQLAWEEKANFDHLVTIRPETVFICTNRMYQDLGKLLILVVNISLVSWDPDWSRRFQAWFHWPRALSRQHQFDNPFNFVLDLTSYDSIKNVYLLGSKSMMSDYKIKLAENCNIFKIYHEQKSDVSGRFTSHWGYSKLWLDESFIIKALIWKLLQDIMPTENEILLNEKTTYEEKQKIWDYEHIANKNRVCTYNFRSAFIAGSVLIWVRRTVRGVVPGSPRNLVW